MNQEHADATWVLGTYDTEADARVAELTTSLQYGLPTLPFIARPGRGHDDARGVVGNQELLDRLFVNLDTETRGRSTAWTTRD